MPAEQKSGFQAQISKSIEVLGAKNAGLTELDVMAAENMLIYAECIVSCLKGFIHCSAQENPGGAE